MHTHACIYFRKICYVYILNMNVNIFKIYTEFVCIYIYIITIHSKHTHILCKQKLSLDVIQKLEITILNMNYTIFSKVFAQKEFNIILTSA